MSLQERRRMRSFSDQVPRGRWNRQSRKRDERYGVLQGRIGYRKELADVRCYE